MTKVIYNYLHFRELLILGRLKNTFLVTRFTKHLCTASQFAIFAICNNVAGAVRNRLLKGYVSAKERRGKQGEHINVTDSM